MRRLIIIPSILFAVIFSAHATSVELPITPKQLDQQNYKFSVTGNATNNNVAFHIIITAKQNEVASDSKAKLAVVQHPKDRHGTIMGTSFAPFVPVAPVTLNQDQHTWTADFTLSRQSLKTPGLCFIFSEQAHTTVGSKIVAMPSVTLYEIQLKDFVKQ